MIINLNGMNIAGDHGTARQTNGNSAFGSDRVTLSPRAASGSWDYNWRADANPQADNERIRRINAIKAEIDQALYQQRDNGNKLQQIPQQIYQKENERAALEREKSQLLSEVRAARSEKDRMEADRTVAKENDRYGYPPPPGAYGWGEVINGINDKIYPVLDKIRNAEYRIREIEYAMNDKTRDINQLRNDQSRLQEEASRVTWFVKERASEWKAVYASMDNPSYDLACPYW